MTHGYIDDRVILGNEIKFIEFKLMKSGYRIVEVFPEEGHMDTIPVKEGEDLDGYIKERYGIDTKGHWQDEKDVEQYYIADSDFTQRLKVGKIILKEYQNHCELSYEEPNKIKTCHSFYGRIDINTIKINNISTEGKWRIRKLKRKF